MVNIINIGKPILQVNSINNIIFSSSCTINNIIDMTFITCAITCKVEAIKAAQNKTSVSV